MTIIDSKNHIDRLKSIKEIPVGGMWELRKWEIQYDVPVYDPKNNKCPHLGEQYIVRKYESNEIYYDYVYANCPRVVVAYNESGYNNTGVCLDCILSNV